MARYPRLIAVVIWPPLFVLVHVLVPFAISRMSVNHEWIGGRPGPWNLFALIAVGAGAAGIAWGTGLHLVETGASIEMETTPKYLLRGGPYRFSSSWRRRL